MSARTPKREALRRARALNPTPERVLAALFARHPFFDPRDKPQVKYELLRSREVDETALHQVCAEFGFSRESYRHILARFQAEGMAGLFEHKRGRRTPLKVTAEVRTLLRQARAGNPEISVAELGRLCQQHAGLTLSRRTIYRLLATLDTSRKKKRRRPPAGRSGRRSLPRLGR